MPSFTPCTFCSDGSPVPFVNQTVPFLADEFNLAGLEPTCGLVDAAIESISSTDSQCTSLRLFGSYCGCPGVPDHCVFCPKPGDNYTMPNLVVPKFNRYGVKDLTCEEIFYAQYQLPKSSGTCAAAQSQSYLCGCNSGQFSYLGADTIAKKRVLVWMPRISAFLSLLGSLTILTDIYRHYRKPLDQYHELVACICGFDLFASTALMFTTLPIPPYDSFGLPTGIYGAHGTVATCKLQGFFYQLGLTGK
jgi:hypothetical protein